MKAENYRVRLLEANLYDTFRRVREFSNWNKKKKDGGRPPRRGRGGQMRML